MSKRAVKATVILPTTKDRGPLLPFCVGSILNQSISDLELFIIGDGVDEDTRRIILDLQESDNRIHFFDHPKGPRRGEIYRHEALNQHAAGEIVCYLLDRDLMLPDHIEKMYAQLMKYNFCVHTSLKIPSNPNKLPEVLYKPFLGTYAKGQPIQNNVLIAPFYFSQVGHTLDFYKQLPYGWRTTPSRFPTDVYMWRQFTNHENINMISTADITILYFKRGGHPGLPAEERAKEIEGYFEKIRSSKEIESLKSKVIESLLETRINQSLEPILIRGHKLSKVPKLLFSKIAEKFRRRW